MNAGDAAVMSEESLDRVEQLAAIELCRRCVDQRVTALREAETKLAAVMEEVQTLRAGVLEAVALMEEAVRCSTNLRR